MPTYVAYMPSPLGPLRLVGDGTVLFSVTMTEQRHAATGNAGWHRDDSAFEAARQQLDEYFAGQRQTFDLALAPNGTAFQQRVWAALADIPFGHTENYGELARRIGSPRAARAVGLANGRNPIPIIVPCHRVIGADGSLTGYGGGIERKRWLLQHEGLPVPASQTRLI
ncbi:methylated-DNA--[protein]-cysteine S-methyltransferase [Salinisphaera hydrothermalis]|uniref:Methylated-DNA--protein-cysteine methyltransferase n=1 Tax=Salinisphaera hydrothermalis (strain C41B8) TaxID=1304275 RepID=A0A084IGM0_SALHC|nr:methylated-DNA--[protein]-cysteine S-methyltransferase [Salinisphaera hydrothermalis]KEZ75854.1 methylated-DNA--protein-cysteine methyltransferase [Salinisphaera hydrothermalis C41B8]